jgi:hypothetical protein
VFRHKGKDQAAETESSALQAEVDRLSPLSPVALAVELMDKAFTGEAGLDGDEPPWSVLFGRAPTAYEIANWLYLPRSEELDASGPVGRVLYGLVSEALQVLEHASLIRSMLNFGFQGALADAHMTYALTGYGVSVRDAGAVERVLNGGTLSTT